MTSKYHREIKPGVWVDVYSVLVAFGVTNPADAHAIKKMLMPGRRGVKDGIQDREEAIASLKRAIEIEREPSQFGFHHNHGRADDIVASAIRARELDGEHE